MGHGTRLLHSALETIFLAFFLWTSSIEFHKNSFPVHPNIDENIQFFSSPAPRGARGANIKQPRASCSAKGENYQVLLFCNPHPLRFKSCRNVRPAHKVGLVELFFHVWRRPSTATPPSANKPLRSCMRPGFIAE